MGDNMDTVTSYTTLPFLLLHSVDEQIDRGYTPHPSSWKYDPVSQTSDLLLMGETHPTTMSSVSTWMGGDDENGSDDKGTD
jgi:hypothetical protein